MYVDFRAERALMGPTLSIAWQTIPVPPSHVLRWPPGPPAPKFNGGKKTLLRRLLRPLPATSRDTHSPCFLKHPYELLHCRSPRGVADNFYMGHVRGGLGGLPPRAHRPEVSCEAVILIGLLGSKSEFDGLLNLSDCPFYTNCQYLFYLPGGPSASSEADSCGALD